MYGYNISSNLFTIKHKIKWPIKKYRDLFGSLNINKSTTVMNEND